MNRRGLGTIKFIAESGECLQLAEVEVCWDHESIVNEESEAFDNHVGEYQESLPDLYGYHAIGHLASVAALLYKIQKGKVKMNNPPSDTEWSLLWEAYHEQQKAMNKISKPLLRLTLQHRSPILLTLFQWHFSRKMNSNRS